MLNDERSRSTRIEARNLRRRGVRHGFVAADTGALPPAAWLPAGLWLPEQVHGARVVQPQHLAGRPADGLWQRGPGRPLGIRTADCVPVLLAAPEAGMVAAIHAGWRGAADRIVERFLQRMIRRGLPASVWAAALGPAADGCCYEVGPEVPAALGIVAAPTVDLRRLIHDRLEALGVEDVESVGPCTICGGSPWASWRRQGASAGRNVAWIAPPGRPT